MQDPGELEAPTYCVSCNEPFAECLCDNQIGWEDDDQLLVGYGEWYDWDNANKGTKGPGKKN